MKFLNRLLLFALLAGAPTAVAQNYTDPYQVIYETTMTGTTDAVTLSLPVAAPFPFAQVTLIAVQVDQAYAVYIERDGTFPTNPSVLVAQTKVNPGLGNSSLVAYSNSNSTGGVKLTPTITLPASTYMPFAWDSLFLNADAAARVTVKVTSSVGAKLSVQIYYKKRR
jgi:hypothetical protein